MWLGRGMHETVTIFSERVDDLPLLLAPMAQMGVQPLLDTHLPTPGTWQGLSLGWVTVIWLPHIRLARGASVAAWGVVGGTTAPLATWVHRSPQVSAGRQRGQAGPRMAGAECRCRLEHL